MKIVYIGSLMIGTVFASELDSDCGFGFIMDLDSASCRVSTWLVVAGLLLPLAICFGFSYRGYKNNLLARKLSERENMEQLVHVPLLSNQSNEQSEEEDEEALK